MKKQYPYLEDSYFYNTDVEREKRTVLEDIQKFANQRQYIKITLLDWEEHPLKEIEGEISSGSITKNADSPVRRTANLSCAVDARSYSVEDGKADFAINKKIFIEIGILNETDKYPDYPIFWFPQGVFFIGSFAINSSSTGTTNISLTLKDKMAMLNGDVGGTLPALVIFDSMDTQLPDGTYATKKVLIYNIIKECVNHYGGEDLNNIVIEDIPLRIRRIMQWTGDTPLYMINTPDIAQAGEVGVYTFQLEQPNENTGYHTYYHGDDIGYIRDDFVVTGELVGNAGETVTSILDKIKNLLGNYEYFYDVFGIFHFREIKNYLNTTQGEKLLSEMAEKDYLVEINNERSTFTFSDETILTSITVTPKYENIKNDFIVQGLREGSSSDIAYDIRYHLAIDTKPRPIGIDERAVINFPRDFSKEIEAGKADVLTLQNKITEGKHQQQINNASLERLNRQKESRYREVIKYGDLLKRELQFILGEFSYPQDQPLGQSKLEHGYATYDDWNEVTGLPNKIPRLYYRDEFWNNYTEQFATNATDTNFLKEVANKSITYSQKLFDSLTPEGFWKVINGSWFSPSNKALQTLYKLQEETKYLNDLQVWNTAYEKALAGTDGYKLITANMIQTNEKIYLYKPIEKSWTNYPNSYYTVALSALCDNSGNNNDIINRMKNIYTDYIVNLQLKQAQQANTLSSVTAQINTLRDEEQEWINKINRWNQNNPLSTDEPYTTCKGELLKVQAKLIELTGAGTNTQDNFNSLTNLYSDSFLLKKHEALHELYEQYRTELKNLYEVIKKINDITTSNANVDKTSDKAIHETLSLLQTKNYFPANGSKTVLKTLEDKITNPIFDATSTELRRDYITVWTKILDNLNTIIENWEKGAINAQYSNPHLGDKYYAFYDSRAIVIYEDPETKVLKAGFCFNSELDDSSELYHDSWNLPVPGNFNLIYKKGDNQYCYWDGKVYKDLVIKHVFDPKMGQNSRYYAYDWRTALYLQGQYARIAGTDAGYYYPELSAFWPTTYDLLNQCFYGSVQDKTDTNDRDLTKGNYYLDFLDSIDTTFGEWSVHNIGRRSDVVVNNEINCLFQPEIPNVNLINISPMGPNVEIYDESTTVPDSLKYLEQLDSSLKGKPKIMYLRAESKYENEPFSQVDSSIYNNLLTGGYANGAFDQIKYELFLHTRYQKNISMTSIPVFYLEPNSRVTLADKTTNTFGDFVIQNISLTLGPGANMSVSMVETIERF